MGVGGVGWGWGGEWAGIVTGVRVGLAAAKGLCEAVGLRLVAVSRLEMLEVAAGLEDGLAVLDAGRGEFYVRVVARESAVQEVLCGLDELREMAAGGRVVVAEERLLDRLSGLQPEMIILEAARALPLVLREFKVGSEDAALVDANYVRGEREIYGKVRDSVNGDGV